MSLLFTMQSRLVIAFLPRSKHLLISWLQSPSAVILEPPKIKSTTVSIGFPSICHEVMVLDAMIFVFWMLSFKPAFSLSSFTFIQRFFILLCFLPLGWCHLHIWSYWYFCQQSWFQFELHPAWHFSAYKLNKFLGCSSVVSASPTSLAQQLFERLSCLGTPQGPV